MSSQNGSPANGGGSKFGLFVKLFLVVGLLVGGWFGYKAVFGPKPLKVAVSVYAGWMPWYYANEEGIIKKWADRYGCEIEVVYMDYPSSLEAFVTGQVDAVVMTNMEAMDMPAAAGIDTTVVVMGDYSNGNDKVLVRNNLTLDQLKGKDVAICQGTVSQYLLARALSMKSSVKEADVNLINVSDADISAQFLANRTQEIVVTWNPMALEIQDAGGVTDVFNSSAIPGEIQDLLVVNTRVLKHKPDFARALVGAWYETLGIMKTPGAASENAINKMAALAKTSPENFRKQLETTYMYWTAPEAVAFTQSKDLQAKNDLVRKFCFEHGLLKGCATVDHFGISYPDGTVQGDPNNIKLRYDSTFMEEYAAGKISLK